MTATDDGSLGFKGSVAGLLKSTFSAKKNKKDGKIKIYACGPAEMFRALALVLRKVSGWECEVSFEQFMGCGVGVCRGCAVDTNRGYQRACKDGPVFDLKEVKLSRD
jgi:dihydroorotate dehydrogenase electron transfer subunit